MSPPWVKAICTCSRDTTVRHDGARARARRPRGPAAPRREGHPRATAGHIDVCVQTTCGGPHLKPTARRDPSASPYTDASQARAERRVYTREATSRELCGTGSNARPTATRDATDRTHTPEAGPRSRRAVARSRPAPGAFARPLGAKGPLTSSPRSARVSPSTGTAINDERGAAAAAARAGAEATWSRRADAGARGGRGSASDLSSRLPSSALFPTPCTVGAVYAPFVRSLDSRLSRGGRRGLQFKHINTGGTATSYARGVRCPVRRGSELRPSQFSSAWGRPTPSGPSDCLCQIHHSAAGSAQSTT